MGDCKTFRSIEIKKVNFYFHLVTLITGPAHIISISSEFYGYLPLGLLGDRIERQYDWLVADLKQANQDRATRPWLIVMMHRPFYCDDNSIWNCKLISNFLRKGVDGKYQLEKLFHENGVDLMFVGHMHNYERFYPIYDEHVFKDALGQSPLFSVGASRSETPQY